MQAGVGRVDPLAARAADRYGEAAGATLRPLRGGLINQTWSFEGPAGRGVLQRLHPIFGPEVHVDIEAVTRHLTDRGLATPRLFHTRDGDLWVDLTPDGVWRAMSFIDGRSLDRADSPAQLAEAGALLARFHRACADLEHDFRFARAAVHDTDVHLRRLATVAASPGDDLSRGVARAILRAGESLRPLPHTPQRVLHGDPKLNNVRFDRAGRRARCMIDLDTLRRGPLAHDLGDAWRSWCNRSGEDEGAARFDLALLDAAVRGYADAAGGLLEPAEIDASLIALERITLELAARFCTDVFEDSYFGWDRTRYPSRREHNLIRARSQLSLHEAVIASRRDARSVVEDAFSG